MPTSATGNKRARADAGFTLVEALVAIAVIALLAGMAMIASPGPDRQLQAQAERFAAFIARGADESVMANTAMALTVTTEGYSFARRTASGWARGAVRPWPAGVDISVQESEAALSEGRVLVYDRLGEASPARIRMASAGAAFDVRVDGEGRVSVERVS